MWTKFVAIPARERIQTIFPFNSVCTESLDSSHRIRCAEIGVGIIQIGEKLHGMQCTQLLDSGYSHKESGRHLKHDSVKKLNVLRIIKINLLTFCYVEEFAYPPDVFLVH